MLQIYDVEGNGYGVLAEVKETNGVNGERSLTGIIFTNDTVIHGIDAGWRMRWQDEYYVIIYAQPTDLGDTVQLDFDAVHEFFYDMSKSVADWTLNGSHTMHVYLSKIFENTDYRYSLEAKVPAFRKENFGHKNRLSLFNEIISASGVEFSVVSNVVKIVPKVGKDLSTVVRKGFNLNELRIEKNIGDFITAKKGYGAWENNEERTGPRLEVEYVSPLAKVYGRLEGDPIVDERYAVVDNLYAQLKSDVDNSYNLAVELDMEALVDAGYNHDQPKTGDYIMAINEDLGFKQRVRIVSYTSYFDTAGQLIKHEVSCNSLGMSRLSSGKQKQMMDMVQDALAKSESAEQSALRAGVSADGRNTNYYGPEDPDPTKQKLRIGDTWFDTKNNLIKVFNGVEFRQHGLDPVKFERGMADVNKMLEEAQKSVGDTDRKAKEALDKAGIATDLASENRRLVDEAKAGIATARTDLDKVKTDLTNSLKELTKKAGQLSETDRVLTEKATELVTKSQDLLEKYQRLGSQVNTLAVDIDTVQGQLTSKADRVSVDNLSKTVRQQTNAISQNAEEIASKANQLEINQIKSTVDKNTTAITQTAKDITSKADKTTVDQLNKTVTNQGTQISQLNNAISLKANQSNLNTLTNQVSKLQSDFSVETGRIRQSVSSAQATIRKEIDEKILADNQIKDTRDTNQAPSWYWANYPRQTVKEFKTYRSLSISNDFGFGVMTTDVPWSDLSGGPIKQSFESSKGLFRRESTGRNSWSTWIKLADNQDITQTQNLIESTDKQTRQLITQIKNNRDTQLTRYNEILNTVDKHTQTIGKDGGNIAQKVMTDSAFKTEIIDQMDFNARIANSRPMTDDPDFQKGRNGLIAYNNLNNGKVFMADVKYQVNDNPNPNKRAVLLSLAGKASPNRGGFMHRLTPDKLYPGMEMVLEFQAKIPSYLTMQLNNNWLGTGGLLKFLTDNKGTDKYENYRAYCKLGAGHNLLPVFYVSFMGGNSSQQADIVISKAEIYSLNAPIGSTITQLSDSISLKVAKGDLLGEINHQAGRTLIQQGTNKLMVTDQNTVIGNGIIKNAMIQDGAISNAKIANATITSAKISSLDVAKISGLDARFVRTLWNSGSSSIFIDGDQLISRAANGSETHLRNGGLATRDNRAVTIGEIGYTPHSNGSPQYTISMSWGSHFVIRMAKQGTNRKAFQIDSGGTNAYFYLDSTLYLKNRLDVEGESIFRGSINLMGGHVLNTSGYRFDVGGEIYASKHDSTIVVTSSYNFDLRVHGNNKKMYIDNYRVFFYEPINMQGHGIFQQSDIRLKKNIKKTKQDSLALLNQIDFVNFDFKEGSKDQFGVIAQQVDRSLTQIEPDGYMAVDVNRLNMMTAHALQQEHTERKADTDMLKTKLAMLEDQVSVLKERLGLNEKNELVNVISFLDKLSLKGRASIGRTKVKQALMGVMDGYTQDQTEIIDEFDAWTDKEKGQYEIKDESLKQSLDDLGLTAVKVTLDTPFLDDLKIALEGYDQDLSGQDADSYATLYAFLEEDLENE